MIEYFVILCVSLCVAAAAIRVEETVRDIEDTGAKLAWWISLIFILAAGYMATLSLAVGAYQAHQLLWTTLFQ
jgi:hypothetical protein